MVAALTGGGLDERRRLENLFCGCVTGYQESCGEGLEEDGE